MNLNPSFLLIDLPVFLAQIPSDEPDGGQSKLDSLVSTIVGFLPIALFLAVLIYFFRRQLKSPLLKLYPEYLERQMEHNKRVEALLERVVKALETKDKNIP